MSADISVITIIEIKKALKVISRGKAAGEEGITVDQLKVEGDIVVAKLSNLYTKCLRTLKEPASWKNDNVILIDQKGDVKELTNYRPMSLLTVVYKLFTKVILNRIGEI